MSSDVRDVGEGGSDLINAERVLDGEGVGRFTSREGSHDRGNVDARAGQTRLPESYVGIHRNAREHFHTPSLALGPSDGGQGPTGRRAGSFPLFYTALARVFCGMASGLEGLASAGLPSESTILSREVTMTL